MQSVAIALDDDDFNQIFAHVNQRERLAYQEAIAGQKCQLFRLEHEDLSAFLITSVTQVLGVRYFNVLELAGDFGYITYPQEFFDLVIEKGKKAGADELRVMLARDGGQKRLKEYGFDLKYSEWGFPLK